MTTRELYDKLIGIYNPQYINIEGGGELLVEESQTKGKDIFRYLKLYRLSESIKISEELLGNANNSYKGKPAPQLSRSCDGIIVTENNGKNYIVLVELKSAFRDGIKSGKNQLKVSEFKILSLLDCVDGFSIRDYYVCAILALRKPTPEDITKIQRKERIGETLYPMDELMKNVYTQDIVRSDISKTKYMFDHVPLKHDFCSEDLPTFIFTVQSEASRGSLDLGNLLDSM